MIDLLFKIKKTNLGGHMSKKLTIITFIFFASAAVSLYAADVAGD